MIYDPDYARAYSIVRCTAWMYGYAALLHGSFTRDLDVVLVPWTDKATKESGALIKHIASQVGWKIQNADIKPEHGKCYSDKPHGRKTWSLVAPDFDDPRWIDISVMPMQPLPPLPEEQKK